MICSICKKGETSVVDSRPTEDGTAIRRRRLCVCGARFTTFERVQFREIMVVKKNGRKSSFDRDKLSKSVYIALKKRPGCDSLGTVSPDSTGQPAARQAGNPPDKTRTWTWPNTRNIHQARGAENSPLRS